MTPVIIESPYAGDIDANVEYARRAMRDSLSRGEAPIASHLLYTQPGILRDEDPRERQWGIDAGLIWGDLAVKTVIYVDRGISTGMRFAINYARCNGRVIVYRWMDAFQSELLCEPGEQYVIEGPDGSRVVRICEN
jgi:hypothetical protein